MNDEAGQDSGVISIDQSACVDVHIDGTDAFSMKLNAYGLSAMQGERGESSATFSRLFDFKNMDDRAKNEVIEHTKKFMRLHFSYAKTKDNSGITLYANY